MVFMPLFSSKKISYLLTPKQLWINNGLSFNPPLYTQPTIIMTKVTWFLGEKYVCMGWSDIATTLFMNNQELKFLPGNCEFS